MQSWFSWAMTHGLLSAEASVAQIAKHQEMVKCSSQLTWPCCGPWTSPAVTLCDTNNNRLTSPVPGKLRIENLSAWRLAGCRAKGCKRGLARAGFHCPRQGWGCSIHRRHLRVQGWGMSWAGLAPQHCSWSLLLGLSFLGFMHTETLGCSSKMLFPSPSGWDLTKRGAIL